jgi:hypothetical protein
MTEEQRLIAQIDAALWKDAWSEKTAALEACRKYLHSVTNAVTTARHSDNAPGLSA